MSLTEKLFKERSRKIADNLQRDELDDLLPDAARHIVRLNSTPQNPVKTVILIHRFSFIVLRPEASMFLNLGSHTFCLGMEFVPRT
jgi:hypothetical protein